MAGTGPAPKFPEQRRRKNDTARGEWVDLPSSAGEVPDLPPGEWEPRASDAWVSWWSDPAASQWSEAQYAEVVVLLALTDEFWGGNYARAAEMRLRADGLGLTQKGKRDLRWRVPREGDPVREVKKPAAKRRAKLKVV